MLSCAVFVLQSSKGAPNIVSDWSSTKASTEQTMKLMQMYKDLGDFEGQVRQGERAAAAAGLKASWQWQQPIIIYTCCFGLGVTCMRKGHVLPLAVRSWYTRAAVVC